MTCSDRYISYTILIAVSLIAATASANPQITGIMLSAQGLSNGASMTISGNSFGTKTPAKPFLWADFANGSIQPSSLGQQTQWSQIQNMVYSVTGGPNNGPYAAGTPQSATGIGSGDIWSLAIDANGFTWNTLGAKYYIFKKSIKNFDVVGPNLNWKSFRTWGVDPGTGNLTNPSFYLAPNNGNIFTAGIGAYGSTEAAPYAAENGVATNPDAIQGPIGQWFPEEIIYRVNSSTSSNDGRFWWYVNNSQVAQLPIDMGWTTYHLIMRDATTGEDMTRLFLQGVAENATSFPITNTFGLDDIYVDNTWSRVMIGNASTWATTSIREIEIPTAWSDGAITISVHNDTFQNVSKDYLYVIDSNGNVNQNGYSLCSYCPPPPSGVRVQ